MFLTFKKCQGYAVATNYNIQGSPSPHPIFQVFFLINYGYYSRCYLWITAFHIINHELLLTLLGCYNYLIKEWSSRWQKKHSLNFSLTKAIIWNLWVSQRFSNAIDIIAVLTFGAVCHFEIYRSASTSKSCQN